MDVSIIIVSYNTKELLKNCLESIFKYTQNLDFEVIVSDNSSTDGSIEMIESLFPRVVLLKNSQNYGFGKANNLAKKIAKGKYIFYLNSDTILLNDAVKIFYDYFENNISSNNIGVIGTMLLDDSMNFNTSYGSFPTPKHMYRYLIRCFLSSIRVKYIYSLFCKVNSFKQFYGEVEYVMGADMFLLNNDDAIFDEQFFMYFEETDLQKKMNDKGKKSIIIKGPEIIHLEGGSEQKSRIIYDFRKRTSSFYWESCIKYLYKYYPDSIYIKKIINLLNFIYKNPWNKRYTKGYINNITNILKDY